MLSTLTKLAGALMPPDDPTTRWRYTVSTTLLAITALLGFHVAWACGWVPGLEGFAQAQELTTATRSLAVQGEERDNKIEEVRVVQHRILSRITETQIEDARENHCHAIVAGNPEAVAGWLRTLQSLLSEYRDQTDRDYILRPCEEY